MNNQPNTNTAAAAQETMNSLAAPPPEKKPSKLSGILDKVGKSPLFMGKRKFITLPLFTLALAAIIVVPIVIINANRPPLEPPNPLDDPVFVSWVKDLAQEIQTSLDEGDGDIEGALAVVNDMLGREYDPPRRRRLLNSKAALVASVGRYDEAITAIQELIDFATNQNNAIEEGLSYLAELYYNKGDKQKALELFRQALGLAIETEAYQGNDYYISMIRQIENELNGAAQ